MCDGCDCMTLAWQVLNESFLLTLNFEPIIVTNSHSWPMLNLLDQVQLGMVCVQVKSFPFWSTSVITLWSVLALSSPAAAELKWMETQMYPFLTNMSIGKSAYQLRRGTPHNCLDSPAHISQWKTWCWNRTEEASKELIRQIKKQEWPVADTDFLFAFERLPTSASLALSPHHMPTPYVWKRCQPLFLKDNFVRLPSAKIGTWQQSQVFPRSSCQVFLVLCKFEHVGKVMLCT